MKQHTSANNMNAVEVPQTHPWLKGVKEFQPGGNYRFWMTLDSLRDRFPCSLALHNRESAKSENQEQKGGRFRERNQLRLTWSNIERSVGRKQLVRFIARSRDGNVAAYGNSKHEVVPVAIGFIAIRSTTQLDGVRDVLRGDGRSCRRGQGAFIR